ncbi:MAG: protein kinase domain-containing protein [Nannocystales bacterium]
MKQDSTRSDSGLSPEAPPQDVGSEAMKAAIASDLFGDIAAPLRVGRYDVREVLGQGGMGVVYSAWDESLGRAVALKLLSATSGTSDRRRARMMREAQALAKLSHPNVVQIYEVGTHDDDVFVAMELVDGLTLREWARQSDRSTREIEGVFTQAASGLSAAHQRDLVHRDFKPSNVIVGSDGRVRVVDFGLAYGPGLGTESAEPSGTSSTSAKLTHTGAVLGTPAYMAPEQFRGEVADARADQFSFCVSLFEALTGGRPYRYADLRDDPAAAKVDGWASVPRMWRSALRRGLSIGPAERWPTVDALVDAMNRGRARWRRGPWLAAGGVGLVLWAPWSGGPSDPCEAVPVAPAGWNEERASSLAASFTATGAPFAADVWATARSNIESFAAEWTETRNEVCRVQPSADTLACLDRAQTVLSAVLAEYQQVNATTVGSIHPLSALLESPASCLDPEKGAFSSEVNPDQLALLARARAELAATRPDAALATLDRLAEDPDLKDTDAIAEVFRLRSQGHATRADTDAALADLARSLQEASSPVVRSRSLVAWVRLLADQERTESAVDGLRLLEPAVSAESPASLRADVLELRARLHASTLNQTMTLLEDALRLRISAGDERRATQTRLAIANGLSQAEDPDSIARGEALLRDVMAERRLSLGDQHPEYAVSLSNLGAYVADVRLDWDEAQQLLAQADRIAGRSLGTDAPARARTRLKLGEVLIRLGRLDEAETMLDSAWARLQSLPETHTDHIAGRTLLASFTLNRGDFATSLEHHRVLETLAPDDVFIQQNIAYLSGQLGNATDAETAVARARALATVSPDLDPPTRALLELYFRTIDAQVARLRDQSDAARTILKEIEAAAAAYEVPDDRPDLAAQLELLQPEIETVRDELSAP